MQNLTTEQKSHLYEGGHVGVTVTGETLDGDPIALTEDDIIEGSFSIDRNWTSGSTIEIGCAETSELIFELDNADGRWSAIRWEGARLTVVWDIDGEPLEAGIFTVDEPPRKLTTMQIRALDDMARFNRPYEPAVAFPASLKQILLDCCQQCNVALETLDFTNGDYTVSQAPVGDDITFHHVVGWIAELAGCNAWIDELARLRLSWYGDQQQPTDDIELTPDDRFSYELAEADITITGIVYRTTIPGEDGADDEEIDYLAGADDYALIIEENPLLQGGHEQVLNALYSKLGGFSYRPFDFETLSYPHLWPGDRVTKIIDAEGGEHHSIITNHLFKLNGNSRIEARGETETVRGYATGAPFTPRQKSVLQSVARVEAARKTSSLEQATLRLNELMANSLGFYTTVVELETGAKITYTHDKSTLEESMIIWTITEQGFAWTDQGWQGGQPTWQYGVTADGSAIVKLLDAVGIRAEWIQVGSAGDYISGEIDDARDYARNLLQSLADGTYSGGTFIDGTTLYSPNIVGLNIFGMTGEFDRLWAGDRQGAHVEIGEESGLPFVSLHDDAGAVVTAHTKEGIMMDSRGRITFPYLDSGAGEIRTYRIEGRRMLMIKGGENTSSTPDGGGINIYHPNDSTNPGEVRIYGGGSEAMRIMADQSARFYGDVQVDGDLTTNFIVGGALTSTAGNRLRLGAGGVEDHVSILTGGDLRMNTGAIQLVSVAGTNPQIRTVGGSGRQGIVLQGQETTNAGVIYIYGNSDSTNPGQVLIFSGGSSTLRMYNDQSVRFYGDLRYDGGLYRGTTRGVPRADVRTGTNSASGSINAGGFISISMADYSFFPNVYSGAIVLSVNAQNDTSTGTTGRFLLRNEGTTSYPYVVRWRYITT